MRTFGRRSRRELVGGVAAVAAPTIMWIEFLAFGLTTPGYSVVTRAASDLGARGARDAGLFVVGFFYLAGALTVVLGASLALAPRARRTWRLGASVIVLEGVLLVLTGAFPEDLRTAGASQPHQLLATACFAAASVSPVVLAAGATRFAPPPVLRLFWLTCGGALLLLLVGATVARGAFQFPDGLFQRPFGVVLTAWFVGTGLWLLRGTGAEA